MTKKKNTEKMELEKLRVDLERLEERIHLIPDPVRKVKVDQQVRMGSLKGVKVEKILKDGKILLLSYEESEKNGGGRKGLYTTWMDIVYLPKNEEQFSKPDKMRIQFSQQTIDGIFTKAYHFGIDFEPDYQRDYVWTKKDKEALIHSIFENVEIGKFVFVKYGSEKLEELNYKYCYEVLDGKQRTRTLLDFYESRFKYKGYYFHELSKRDQIHFENYSVSVAMVDELTEEQALQYFIKLNTSGKSMSKKHLESIEQRLQELQTK